MKIVDEFKQFAMRGSVIDLAVGIIIGGAFQKIVSSLVADIITPPLGLVTGHVNFATRHVVLRAAQNGQDAITLNWGLFVQNVIDFLIMAFVIFLLVKGINHLRRSRGKDKPEDAPAPTTEEKLLTEIRDLLKEQR